MTPADFSHPREKAFQDALFALEELCDEVRIEDATTRNAYTIRATRNGFVAMREVNKISVESSIDGTPSPYVEHMMRHLLHRLADLELEDALDSARRRRDSALRITGIDLASGPGQTVITTRALDANIVAGNATIEYVQNRMREHREQQQREVFGMFRDLAEEPPQRYGRSAADAAQPYMEQYLQMLFEGPERTFAPPPDADQVEERALEDAIETAGPAEVDFLTRVSDDELFERFSEDYANLSEHAEAQTDSKPLGERNTNLPNYRPT